MFMLNEQNLKEVKTMTDLATVLTRAGIERGMGLVKGKPPRAGWCPRRFRRVFDE